MSSQDKLKIFMLHWLDGTTTTIKGLDYIHAFDHAGYSLSALSALDYYEEIT